MIPRRIGEVTICRRFEFSASHRLPLHEGKCRRHHGHNYILEVYIRDRTYLVPGPEQGMVADFGWLKQIVEEEIMARFDHHNLNEVTPKAFEAFGLLMPDPETQNVTTAENMAILIWEILNRKRALGILKVRLWETSNCWAEYSGPDKDE